MSLTDQLQQRKKQFLIIKAHEYCFQYYLRKGVRLDPVLLVKATLGDIQQTIERTPSLLADAFFDWLRVLPYEARWRDIHFIKFFYYGDQDFINLAEIGHLEDIKRAAGEDALQKFRRQVAETAYKMEEDGPFTDYFENTYDFGSVQYSHGGATLRGDFSGEVRWVDRGVRRFIGTANIVFEDEYTDPLNKLELRQDYNDIIRHVNGWLAARFNVTQELIPEFVITEQIIRDAEVGGSPYKILAEWEEEMTGEVIKP